MLFLIEGIDGSGKTTLAERLCKRRSMRYEHHGQPRAHPLVEYVDELVSYTPGSGEDVVCDRHYLGELVYGPIYRGKCSMTPAVFKRIETFLKSKGAVLVLMDNDSITLRQRHKDTNESFLKDEDVEVVRYLFEHSFMRSSLIKTRMIDPTDADIDRLIILGRTTEEEAMT
jgi:thymidylate kinase